MPGNLWLSSIGRHCRMDDRTTSRPAVQGAGPAPVHVSGLELQACLRDQRRADEVKAAFNGEVKRSMGGRRVHEGATTRFLVAIRSWQTTRLDWELQKAKCAMFWGGNLVHAFTTQVESMMVTFKSRAPRLTDTSAGLITRHVAVRLLRFPHPVQHSRSLSISLPIVRQTHVCYTYTPSLIPSTHFIPIQRTRTSLPRRSPGQGNTSDPRPTPGC